MKSISQEKRRLVARRIGYFGLPVIIMFSIFAMLHIAPFGKGSLLTYDMGEQYIDFFAFYRDTLLHHPSQLLYSFTNGIGGETLGLWAYYLLSPFNLILLFFSKQTLPLGVFIMTLLKYGCAGLAFGTCLEKMHWTDQKWILPGTISYSLMGWMLANQFNIMWLDVLVFLPFILNGIEKLFNEDRSFYYTTFLALTLFVNFYMGYMVCIFVMLYFIWTAVRQWQGWKNFGQKVVRWGISSLLAAGSVAFLLLPTYFDITKSKGVYTQQNIRPVIEYQPWKMLSKFIIGSLNDSQVQGGLPNLFVCSFIIFGFILYFMAQRIPWREKIASFGICVVMFLAMCWQPLDLIWHAFQYPVFYPYRFSYLVSTWMILLALRGLTQIGKPKLYQLSIAFFIPLICWSIVALERKHFNFLTMSNLIATFVFLILIFSVLVWMLLAPNLHLKHLNLQLCEAGVMLLLVVTECGMNAYQTVKNLGGADIHSYVSFVRNLDDHARWIQNQATKSDFYRIGKTFQRSENDALNTGYHGVSGFTSTQNAAVTSFMNSIGQPNFLGKEVYSNGTLLTDSILGIRYYMAPSDQYDHLADGSNTLPNSSYRPDISFYSPIQRAKGVTIYHNPLALSLGFAASHKVLSVKNDFPSSDMTVDNQTYLLNQVAGTHRHFFEPTHYHTKLMNCAFDGGSTGRLIPINAGQPSSMTISLKNISVNPYYLQVNPQVVWNSSITVNGNALPGIGNATQPVLYNVAGNNPGSNLTISFSPNNGKALDLNDLAVYQFNVERFEKTIDQVMANQLQLTHNGRLQIRGKIVIPHGKNVMMTTIPYNKGWHVQVDGQQVTPRKAFGTFVAVPMTPGNHRVTLMFRPPLLTLGIIITLFAWIILGLCWRYELRR